MALPLLVIGGAAVLGGSLWAAGEGVESAGEGINDAGTASLKFAIAGFAAWYLYKKVLA